MRCSKFPLPSLNIRLWSAFLPYQQTGLRVVISNDHSIPGRFKLLKITLPIFCWEDSLFPGCFLWHKQSQSTSLDIHVCIQIIVSEIVLNIAIICTVSFTSASLGKQQCKEL